MPVLTDPFGWFTVEVPEGWDMNHEDCVTTLRGPRAVGIVYLSAARHAKGRQASFGGADFLARFLRSLGLEVHEEAIRQNAGAGCRVYSYRRDSDAGDWRFWSVTDDETALLVCYAVGPAEMRAADGEAAAEADAVAGIVGSVRLYHSVAS
jgi:hypothetical protein